MHVCVRAHTHTHNFSQVFVLSPDFPYNVEILLMIIIWSTVFLMVEYFLNDYNFFTAKLYLNAYIFLILINKIYTIYCPSEI